jgi:nicotinate-nucleotide--dimethylbenzimidazole phosphoribosyltransferase
MSAGAKPPRTFEDVRALVRGMPVADAGAVSAARARESQLTKPAGALGRLEDIAAWLCAWQGRHPPELDDAQALVFAGNHGVTAQGISAFPAEVTVQMVANFAAGGAAINQLAKAYGAELGVIPLDLDRPTADFSAAPAMSEADCMVAFAAGWEAVRVEADLALVGEMGIGNTTSAAALCRALLGGSSADWAGPGTGLDGAGVARKIEVIDRAIGLHGEAATDPLEALRRVGGRELAAIAGAVLAARYARVPVILDGYVTTAAAAVLHGLDAGALDHCLAGHVSAEPGHGRLLAAIEKDPLISLGMRLGEGSGAAVALGIVRGAVAAHTGMATFAEAGVSGKD